MIQQYKSKYLNLHVYLEEKGIKHSLVSQIEEGDKVTSIIAIKSGMIRSQINHLIRMKGVTLLRDLNKFKVTVTDRKQYNDQGLMKLDSLMRESNLDV